MFTNKNQISLEMLIKKIFEQFENIAEVYVAHIPTVSDVSQLMFTVNTGDVDSYVEYPELTLADEVTVRITEDEQLAVPFRILATSDGAGHPQASAGTTIYMSDDVRGAEPRNKQDGAVILRDKLAGRCPSCGNEVSNLGDHFIRNSVCREYEQV